MKRIASLLLTLTLALAVLPAQAGAEGAYIACSLPAEIADFFSQSKFSGCSITENAYVEMNDTVGGSFAFVVAVSAQENTLYGFEKKNGAWTYWLKTAAALPQESGIFSLNNAKGLTSDYGTPYYSTDTLWIVMTQPHLDYYTHVALFSVNSSGQWHLKELDSYLLTENYHTQAGVTDESIAYYEEGARIGTAYGVVETNLRYFSLSAFPGTYAQARQKLTNAPDIPYGSQLTATNIKFTGGQKFEVYSGPGTQYERAANGKAIVSTNDWIQVFGHENGYILIQYALNANQMRFGYITETALPKNASVAPLYLDADDAEITRNTFLTDDPLNSQTRIRTLNVGQSGVKWLATMGNWVYVEMTGNGQPVRGFVPATAIARSAGTHAYSASLNNGVYTAQATLEVAHGSSMTATVTVVAPASWHDGGGDRIQGYLVYANNVPVAALSSVQKTADATAWVRTFTLSAALPDGTTVVGLCPQFESGLKADETLILSLEY